MKWIKRTVILIGILIFLIAAYFFQPWVFLPHKHLQMSLPFSTEADATTSLIPMGEKIEHNESNGNPDGHPGLDFGFAKETNILAVTNGIITGVSKTEGKYNIEQRTLYYRIRYTELNSVDPSIHIFSLVKKGRVLGSVGTHEDISEKFKPGAKSRQMHWDFGSSSMAIDRLCSVDYFDAESKMRIMNIWDRVPNDSVMKEQYPEICNGIFKEKKE